MLSGVGARRLLNGGLVSGVLSGALVVEAESPVAIALLAGGRNTTFCCAPAVRAVGGKI